MPKIKMKEIEATKLDPNSTYLLQIDCTDVPREQILNITMRLKEMLNKLGLTKFIVYPYNMKNGKIEVVKLKGE